jgi:hypothetical protein
MENLQVKTFINKRNKRNLFLGITLLNGIACLFIVNWFSPLPEFFSTNKVMTGFIWVAVLVYGYFIRKALKELKQNDNYLVLGMTQYAYVLFMQFCMLVVVVASYFLGEVYTLLFVPLHAILYFIEKQYPNAFTLNKLSIEKT